MSLLWVLKFYLETLQDSWRASTHRSRLLSFSEFTNWTGKQPGHQANCVEYAAKGLNTLGSVKAWFVSFMERLSLNWKAAMISAWLHLAFVTNHYKLPAIGLWPIGINSQLISFSMCQNVFLQATAIVAAICLLQSALANFIHRFFVDSRLIGKLHQMNIRRPCRLLLSSLLKIFPWRTFGRTSTKSVILFDQHFSSPSARSGVIFSHFPVAVWERQATCTSYLYKSCANFGAL